MLCTQSFNSACKHAGATHTQNTHMPAALRPRKPCMNEGEEARAGPAHAPPALTLQDGILCTLRVAAVVRVSTGVCMCMCVCMGLRVVTYRKLHAGHTLAKA